MEPIEPEVTARLPAVDAAPRVGEDAFVVPSAPLARGGMAEVYEVQDRRLPRNVILKRPRIDPDIPAQDRATFEARLEAEALVLARLQHPSIVTLYEVGRDRGGRPFCVLEKVAGRSLRARLDELLEEEALGKRRTAERFELLTGLLGIAEALAYAHERGVVHRDVTPNNVLLGARGEMTLIDWGLAKDTRLYSLEQPGLAADRLEANMTIGAGTPPYVCFEQTQGQAAQAGYDVYSLGMTMYEVIAGHPPFKFEVPDDPRDRERVVLEFLQWARRGPAAAPAAPRDPELSGIIARAIERNPDKRFTADELLRALRQYLTGELVFSHRYSLSGRLGRWVRKHRAVTLSAIIALVAVVGAALSWSTLRARDAERARERARDEALVLAQKVEAAEAKERATDAEHRAADAEAAAAKARSEGRESRELQAEAERLRREADSEADRARSAAKDAARDAGEAQARWRLAVAERDAALSAQSLAESARADEARARTAAEAARADEARARTAAETARAAAESARTRAESDRDAARTAQFNAEAARLRAEQERDAAQQSRAAAEAARTSAEASRT
ncbi:MAG TPA: serine/threonine-protein kinase, partial [Kofleriaceae bacterium]|nr:serine/threonine-protein kinase [Kofleriaceae bacterium]